MTLEVDDRLLVSVKEAARMLGLGQTVTWSLVMSGEIASVKIGRRRLVVTENLNRFIARRLNGG